MLMAWLQGVHMHLHQLSCKVLQPVLVVFMMKVATRNQARIPQQHDCLHVILIRGKKPGGLLQYMCNFLLICDSLGLTQTITLS